MRAVLALFVLAAPAVALAGGDFSGGDRWVTEILTIGDAHFAVRNTLHFFEYEDGREEQPPPRYQGCGYPKVNEQAAYAVELGLCKMSKSAPDFRPRDTISDQDRHRRVEVGFDQCRRWTIYAPALDDTRCTAPAAAKSALAAAKGAFAKHGLDLTKKPLSMDKDPSDLLTEYLISETEFVQGRLAPGPICGVQVKGPRASATLIKAGSNGSCGGYFAELFLSEDRKSVVALINNYGWTAVAGWQLKALADILHQLEQ